MSINITGKKILVIGGGNVALVKINSLKRFTDQITIITRETNDEIRRACVPIKYKSYHYSDLDGFFLVYACTGNSKLNNQIRSDCNRMGILINVVDNPGLCDFTSPAIYKKDNMMVAVSSNGKDVKKSIEWRNKISEIFEALC